VPQGRAAETIRELLLTGCPVSFVHTTEEERVSGILSGIAPTLSGFEEGISVWLWSLTEGLRRPGDSGAQPGTESPEGVLDFIVSHPDPGLFQLKDFHHAIGESAIVRRRLRDLYSGRAGRGKFVIITSPLREVPSELRGSIAYVELRPPDLAEINAFVRDETSGLAEPPSPELVTELAPALLGLTMEEIRQVLRKTTREFGALSSESRPFLLEQKRLLLSRYGVLEFVSTPSRMDAIGGLQNLKQWLLERRKLFNSRESLSEEIVPKGVLIMGVPGCGKSLCVKAIAAHFELPLYRLDMIEVFSGRHGNPATAFADACKQMEDIAPAVLWFDELEMAVTSSESSGEQGRIFAFFLTWMQEKVPGLFVAATANRIDLLPAEMIRKGRFDEVFFVDLPTDDERKEIFSIHLSRRGYDPGTLPLNDLMRFTQGWTGAEVEQCVVSAITKAKLADREVAPQDLVTLAARSVPLSRTMREQINHIRGWAFERAVRATPEKSGTH
jgi:hypothetical protein